MPYLRGGMACRRPTSDRPHSAPRYVSALIVARPARSVWMVTVWLRQKKRGRTLLRPLKRTTLLNLLLESLLPTTKAYHTARFPHVPSSRDKVERDYVFHDTTTKPQQKKGVCVNKTPFSAKNFALDGFWLVTDDFGLWLTHRKNLKKIILPPNNRATPHQNQSGFGKQLTSFYGIFLLPELSPLFSSRRAKR